MTPTIRRLHPGESGLYRSARLESLRESPEAFATTHASALARDPESWAAQAAASASGSDRATFLVIGDGGDPLGLGAIYRDPELSHEGELIQVWVSPELRGSDIASRLIDALFQWAAANGFETIRAGVTHANARALRFYEKYGFVPTQLPPDEETPLILTRKVG